MYTVWLGCMSAADGRGLTIIELQWKGSGSFLSTHTAGRLMESDESTSSSSSCRSRSSFEIGSVWWEDSLASWTCCALCCSASTTKLAADHADLWSTWGIGLWKWNDVDQNWGGEAGLREWHCGWEWLFSVRLVGTKGKVPGVKPGSWEIGPCAKSCAASTLGVILRLLLGHLTRDELECDMCWFETMAGTIKSAIDLVPDAPCKRVWQGMNGTWHCVSQGFRASAWNQLHVGTGVMPLDCFTNKSGLWEVKSTCLAKGSYTGENWELWPVVDPMFGADGQADGWQMCLSIPGRDSSPHIETSVIPKVNVQQVSNL